jgi:methylglyoxal/glyoxal reductase
MLFNPNIPLLGLGCWNMWDKEAQGAVETALEIGYRLIDTAAMYRNEAEVGAALRASGLPREAYFVATKVGNNDQGYDNTLRAYEASCQRLGLSEVDIYLVHWPIKGLRQDTWRAMERLYQEEAVKYIGVCNYLAPFLDEMDEYAEVYPMLNQCEFSPYLYSEELVAACEAREIQLQAWSPLVRGKKMNDPRLVALAEKYGKTPAQMLLRWALEQGISTIPKSSGAVRLRENFEAAHFQLSDEDVQLMNTFDEGLRVSDEDPMVHF